MLCGAVVLTGFQVDGGYAQYVKADAAYVGLVPDGLNIEQAAHLTCTGVTAWGALKAAELEAGQWCAVFGLGAVGQYTVQYAKALGPRYCQRQWRGGDGQQQYWRPGKIHP